MEQQFHYSIMILVRKLFLVCCRIISNIVFLDNAVKIAAEIASIRLPEILIRMKLSYTIAFFNKKVPAVPLDVFLNFILSKNEMPLIMRLDSQKAFWDAVFKKITGREIILPWSSSQIAACDEIIYNWTEQTAYLKQAFETCVLEEIRSSDLLDRMAGDSIIFMIFFGCLLFTFSRYWRRCSNARQIFGAADEGQIFGSSSSIQRLLQGRFGSGSCVGDSNGDVFRFSVSGVLFILFC